MTYWLVGLAIFCVLLPAIAALSVGHGVKTWEHRWDDDGRSRPGKAPRVDTR